MKKVLIISPYFAPTNAADSHRVRMSLPYFKNFGWDVHVVTVNPVNSDLVKDELLYESIPDEIHVYQVNAFSKKWTAQIGLGSIALRSLWFYLRFINNLLAKQKFDLIYFSTTQFPICALGPYWKRRFHIPYIIDFQDPWHTDYYKHKPKSERPPKYWFSYRLNKFLEPIALKKVSGLIAVNQEYIDELVTRYPELADIPSSIIQFSTSQYDFEIAQKHQAAFTSFFKKNKKIKIVYVGAVGSIMKESIVKILKAFKSFIDNNSSFHENIELYFLGTSYSPNGKGVPSVAPLAQRLGIEKYVIEVTDRLTYYNAIQHVKNSDALLMAGSDDPNYIGSKIYNYLYTQKKIFSLLHSQSPANLILIKYKNVTLQNLEDNQAEIDDSFSRFIYSIANKLPEDYQYIFEALQMTKLQCSLFEKVISGI
ncbi:glycosyltransferase [Pedobacter miscanthi]|nr:glycosyltransferase [Pedobacter miscanthi]